MDLPEVLSRMRCVRADRDDLSDPADAPLAEHLAAHPEDRATFRRELAFDALLADALPDVPIPAGLAERLLARLTQPTATSESAPVAASADALPLPFPLPTPTAEPTLAAPPVTVADAEPAPARRLSRRVFWTWAATAAGICGTIGVQYWLEASRTFAWDELLNEARNGMAIAQGMASPAAWQPLDTAPEEYRPGPALERRYVQGWLAYPAFLRRSAVVYWLSGPDGKPQGYLFVVRGVPTEPLPDVPTRFENSGGVWAVAWKNEDRLCVLAARGEHRDLERVRHFLRPSRLARLDPPAAPLLNSVAVR